MTDFRRTNLEGVKVVEYRFLRDPTLPSLLFVSINHHLSSVKSRPSPFVLPATYSRPPYPLQEKIFQSSSRHLCLPGTNSFGREGEALCKHMLDLSKGKKRQKSGNLPILEKDSLWKDLEETRFPLIFDFHQTVLFSIRLLRKFDLYLFISISSK